MNVFKEGKMQREFTYIDVIVDSVVRVIDKTAETDSQFDSGASNPATSYAA